MGSLNRLLDNIVSTSPINNIKDPNLNIKMEPFPRPMVEFVDNLMDYARKYSSMSDVTTQGDWDTLAFIYKGWKILYPQDAWNFEHDMMKVRKDTVKKGIVKEGEAMMQHLMNIPGPLYHMIKTIFPNQKWNRKFINKLLFVFPQMRAYEK